MSNNKPKQKPKVVSIEKARDRRQEEHRLKIIKAAIERAKKLDW